ncbi:MAG: Mu-like prophage major head subunit gpT family protein [Pseudomonadota bacterium]
MDLTPENVRNFGVTLNTHFQAGIDSVESEWSKIADLVNSTTSRETYGWLGDLPKMRRWIGDRRLKRIREKLYQLINDDFEDTIAVNRNKFEDNELGTFGTLASSFGRSVAELPDDLVFEALVLGYVTECYDGQNFFDTEHPVGEGANQKLVSNVQAGAGESWFLLCTNSTIKPLIYQERKKGDLVYKGDPEDENVFQRNELIWGSHARAAAGYTFWQMGFASKAELNADNYEAARVAIMSRTDDEGKPLNLKPNLLVVGPANERKGLKLLNNERTDAGATNEYQGTAELLSTTRVTGG